MKSIKTFYIVTFMIFNLVDYSNISFGQQHSIGFTGGYNVSRFYNYSKKPDYDTKYQLKGGFSFASFYEMQLDSVVRAKIELQYGFHRTSMEVNNNAGHSSFYFNVDYSFHLLNLNILYLFRFVNKQAIKANVVFGPTFYYTVNTHAKGNGWKYGLVSQVDTLGNNVGFISPKDWEKDERNSKDLTSLNVGVCLGIELLFPVGKQVDLLVQNKYNSSITGFSKTNVSWTPLFTGSLLVGICYHLKK